MVSIGAVNTGLILFVDTAKPIVEGVSGVADIELLFVILHLTQIYCHGWARQRPVVPNIINYKSI